jgi:hypothetical protein
MTTSHDMTTSPSDLKLAAPPPLTGDLSRAVFG